MMCRATPAGKHGDPEVCEPKVANFLECYHQMIHNSNSDCEKELNASFDCMKKNINNDNANAMCASSLNEFTACKGGK